MSERVKLVCPECGQWGTVRARVKTLSSVGFKKCRGKEYGREEGSWILNFDDEIRIDEEVCTNECLECGYQDIIIEECNSMSAEQARLARNVA